LSTTPPTPRELDRYRERVDRFMAEIDEEYYLHFAGLKPSLELEPIYGSYADLTELEQARTLGTAAEVDPGVRELWRFACENHLAGLTRSHAERNAELEASLVASVDGGEVAFRMLRPTIANEQDRGRRRRLEEARNELTDEHLNPISLEAVGVERQAVRALGAESYTELYERFGFELKALAGQCEAFLESTEAVYEEAIDRLFRDRVGVSLDEAERWDVARLFRAAKWDRWFPESSMVPALEATLADLGLDLRSQRNIELDLERRETKTPRAFCVPIEVPGRVVLVIQPQGGVDDWAGLFHEAGHAEHYACTSADLRVEARRLGDVTVTEGWAMLLQHLTVEPAWLNRRLDFPRPEEFAAEGAAELLYVVRRYAAKLLYELEFHATPEPTELRPRYAEILGDALKIRPSPTDYLGDFDSGYYVTGYLRSWAFEAQLREFLRGEYGNEWFTRREAGSLLRELWEQGSSLNADELLREVADAPIDLEAVSSRVRERLR